MIQAPSPQTLKKYGLTKEDWVELYHLQGGICPICERLMDKPCIDHFHIRGFRFMKPEKKKLYVRGLTCNYCNRRMLVRGMTVQRAKNITNYLERFEEKIKNDNKR